MANSKSAKKRIRVAERNRIRNKGYKTRYRNLFKSIEKLILENKKEEALSLFTEAQKHIDKAAKTGAIHKNMAARKKSRLSNKISSI